MDLREIGWEGMDWVHLAQDRVWWQALVNLKVGILDYLSDY